MFLTLDLGIHHSSLIDAIVFPVPKCKIRSCVWWVFSRTILLRCTWVDSLVFCLCTSEYLWILSFFIQIFENLQVSAPSQSSGSLHLLSLLSSNTLSTFLRKDALQLRCLRTTMLKLWFLGFSNTCSLSVTSSQPLIWFMVLGESYFVCSISAIWWWATFHFLQCWWLLAQTVIIPLCCYCSSSNYLRTCSPFTSPQSVLCNSTGCWSWCCRVARNMRGLASAPNGTLENRKCCSMPLMLNRKRKHLYPPLWCQSAEMLSEYQ